LRLTMGLTISCTNLTKIVTPWKYRTPCMPFPRRYWSVFFHLLSFQGSTNLQSAGDNIVLPWMREFLRHIFGWSCLPVEQNKLDDPKGTVMIWHRYNKRLRRLMTYLSFFTLTQNLKSVCVRVCVCARLCVCVCVWSEYVCVVCV
jgi:hypothetical protein